MDKITLEKMATSAFQNLKEKRDNLFTATENTIEAQAIYELAKVAAFSSGKIDGKNEEARKNQLVEVTKVQLAELRSVEGVERKERYQYDLAQTDVDTVKTLLRIVELP